MTFEGKKYLSIIILIVGFSNTSLAQNTSKCDLICGKWMTVEKNLTIEIYKESNAFRAKILWFDDSDDKTRPVATRLDACNPDVKLRTQTIVGSNVLQNLVYKPDSNSWEEGMIYDANHGKFWNSAACITQNGQLKVTGYWHFKFIGKTLTFTKL